VRLRAEPDGYTIAIGNAGPMPPPNTIYSDVPFKPDAFVPIAVVAKTFGIVAVAQGFSRRHRDANSSLTPKAIRARSTSSCRRRLFEFLICKSFVQAAGIDVFFDAGRYQWCCPALTDTIGGQIDGVCDAAASVSQSIGDRLVKGLVVGLDRAAGHAAGFADVGGSRPARNSRRQGWKRLFAPRGRPEIIAKLNTAARTAVESDAVKKRFADLSTVAPEDQ